MGRKYRIVQIGSSAPALIPVPTPSLSALTVSASEIDLTASYTGPPTLSVFTYQIAGNPGGPWTTMGSSSSTSWVSGGLPASMTFYYRCQVTTTETPARASAFSNIAIATTQNPVVTIPTAPTNFTAVPLSSTATLESWNAVAGATSYNVYNSSTQALLGNTAATQFTNSGLTPALKYNYQVTAVNSAGESPRSAVASATTPALAVVQATKWNPGHYVLTYNWGSLSQQDVEYGWLAAAPQNLQGIAIQFSWYDLEPTQGNVGDIPAGQPGGPTGLYKLDQTFLNFQAQNPGKHLVVYIGANRDLGPSSSPNANNYTTYKATGYSPDWVINCGGNLTSTDGTMVSTNIPVSPNPNQWGWWLSGYNSGFTPAVYTEIVSAVAYHPVVMQCFKNLVQRIAKRAVPQFTANGVVYTGYTYDTHPLIEMVGSQMEMSLDITGQGGFVGRPTADSTVITNGVATPSTPTTQTMRTLNVGLMSAWKAAFPHTMVVSNMSYTLTGTDGVVQTNAQILADMIALDAAGVTFGGSDVTGQAFAQIPTAPFTPWVDVIAGQTGPPYYGHGSTAEHLFIGGTFTTQYNFPPQPGAYDWQCNGIGQIQSDDYDREVPSSTKTASQAAVTAIWNACKFAQKSHVFWCFSGQNTNEQGQAWYTSNVQPVISQLPATYSALPVAFMTAPTGLVASSITATGCTLNWNAAPNAAFVTGYAVFRNDKGSTPIGTTNLTTYADTSAAAGTSYTYTVAMINAGTGQAAGTGPKSGGVAVKTLGASGASPTRVQLLLQGQTVQNAGNDSGEPNRFQPQNGNATLIGWLSVSGASAYNIYRATIPVGQQATALNYVSLASIPAGTALSTYNNYVSATATASAGQGGSGPGTAVGGRNAAMAQTGIDSAYADTAAINCVSGTKGTNDLWAATGYSYLVTAVVGGVESAQSAPSYGDYVNNGVRVLHDNAFNNEPIWNSAAGGTNSNTGNTLTWLWDNSIGAIPYFNPFAGNGATPWELNVRQWNYLQFWIKADQNDSTSLGTAVENQDDILINGGATTNFAAYSTPPGNLTAGTWTFVKIPLAILMTDATRGRQNSFYKFGSFTVNGMNGVWHIDQMRFVT